MSKYQSVPVSSHTAWGNDTGTGIMPLRHAPRWSEPYKLPVPPHQEEFVAFTGPQENPSTPIEPNPSNNHLAYIQWWKPVAWMISLIVLGLAFGIAHHVFNNTLNNRPVSSFSQTWAHNLGTAAAFGIKTSCTLAVALACQEVLWYSMRRKAIQISTLDNMFTLLSNPLSFTFGALRDASLLSILAAFAWLIPLSAILSPGTLTVGPHTIVDSHSCLVPRFPGETSILFGTIPHGSTVSGSNRAVQKMASQVFPYGTALGFTSPCGSNCTYRQSFLGPAMECLPVEGTLNETEYEMAQMVYFYNASTNVVPGSASSDTFMNLFLMYKNTSKPTSTAESPDLPLTFLSCSAYNATYDLQVNFTNGISTFEPKVTINNPLFWVPLTPIYNSAHNYTQANFQSLVFEVYRKLIGSWSGTPTTPSISADTLIGETSLVGNEDVIGRDLWQVKKDLAIGIPELLVNLTLSTISFNTANETVQCTTSSTFEAYIYSPLWLLLPYSLVLSASILATATAVVVLKRMGIRTGSVFSQILVTTRNPGLDEMTRGISLSSSGATALKKQKLRLGELVQYGEADFNGKGGMGQEQHAAFGIQEQVVALKRAERML